MKIPSIPQLVRNANRLREIVGVLIKYGMANWVSRLGLGFANELFKDYEGELVAKHSPATRFRMALTECGPTFIKLGQILSTRGDIVGVELAHELRKLQADVPPDPPEVALATIEAELGQPAHELFSRFEQTPLASASIGQVHRAQLADGAEVIVKVRHADIEEKVNVDLEILAGLAQLAERVPDLQNFRPRETVAEFQRMLRRELDFGREERHMQEFAQNFAGDATIHIPRVYAELSTGRVLTMEFLEGTKLTETAALIEQHFDLPEIARRGAEIYLEMIFTHGFYHADPHPGNILVLEGNVVGLLDYGMVGRIDEPLREDIEEMLLAIANRDAMQLTAVITRLGAVPPGLDRAALSVDVADFVSHYVGQRLDEFNLSGALEEMIEIVHRYRIMLPARVAMLLKVLIMLEGTARLLNPKFNLIEVMQPYQKRLILRRLSPARQLRKMRRIYSELEHLAESLPRGILDIIQQIQSGKFDVHLDHRGLEPSVNRLVYGMLTSALFLGSSLLLSRQVPPLVNIPPWIENPWVPNLSILGLLGCGVSIALGLRLLRAISKSGHLDRR